MVVRRIVLLYSAVVAVIFFTCSVSWAEGRVAVALEIDRTEATLADTVKLVVTVKTEKKASSPAISGLEPFHVRQGGASSRFQMINGEINREFDHVFYLTPKRKGTFTIGPAKVSVKGKRYSSETVNLRVQETVSQSERERSSLFVIAALSTHSGYVGQEFIYNVKFYRARDVRDVSLTPPDAEGLTLKRLGDHKEYVSSLHGKNYTVIELRYSLVADSPGSFTLPPTYFRMSVPEKQDPLRRRGIFSDPFFGFTRTKPLSIGSNSLELLVKPIPIQGRPPDYSGLVGQFSMGAAILPQDVKEGESATFTVNISGKGNVRLIPDLNLPEMRDVKAYADQPVLDVKTGPDGTSGRKTMKWALVPQQEGSITISSMSVSYFDTDSGIYRRMATKPLSMRVLPGTDHQEAPPSEEKVISEKPEKKEVVMESVDIFSIHERPESVKTTGTAHPDKWTMWLLFLIPPLCFVTLFGVMQRKERSRTEEKVLINKKAGSRFLKNMKSVSGPYALSEMSRISNIYLNERMGLSGGSLTPKEVYNALLERGVKSSSAEETEKLLRNMESLLYTGGGENEGSERIKDDLIRIIKKIDKELP